MTCEPDQSTVGGLEEGRCSGPHSSPDAPGSRIPRALQNWDRYQVAAILGTGGMGAVYKARDARLSRWVALKIVHPQLGHGAGTSGEIFVRRFMREARLQASLDHPHICKVFECGELPSSEEQPGYPYIAMQLITGQPLRRAQLEMTLLDKVQVIRQVAEALHCAHRQGLIHRDIKPSKIAAESDTAANNARRCSARPGRSPGARRARRGVASSALGGARNAVSALLDPAVEGAIDEVADLRGLDKAKAHKDRP